MKRLLAAFGRACAQIFGPIFVILFLLLIGWMAIGPFVIPFLWFAPAERLDAFCLGFRFWATVTYPLVLITFLTWENLAE